MSTVSERESGPREMSFSGGFVDKTLQRRHRCRCRTESQRETVHSSVPPRGTLSGGREGKDANRETALASCETSAWRFAMCGCPSEEDPLKLMSMFV